MSAYTRRLWHLVTVAFVLFVLPSPVQATEGISDWLVITDYGNQVQQAINALPSTGGTIYVPRGEWTQSSPVIFPSNKHHIRLIGAGAGASILKWNDGSINCITIQGNFDVIEHLTIRGSGSFMYNIMYGRGIFVDPLTAGQQGIAPLRGFELRNVEVLNTPSYSLEVGSYPNNNWVAIISRLDRCHFSGNTGLVSPGLVKINHGNARWTLTDCSFGSNLGNMLVLDRCSSIRVDGTTFDAGFEDKPFITLNNCGNVAFNECYFERPAEHSEYFVTLTGLANASLTLANCTFVRPGGTAGKVARCGPNQRIKSLTMINPTISFPGTSVTPTGPDVDVVDQLSAVVLIGGIVGNSANFFVPRVVDGTTKTFQAGDNMRVRIPRVTTSERSGLTDLKVGDIVYNSDSGRIEVWNGSSWDGIVTD